MREREVASKQKKKKFDQIKSSTFFFDALKQYPINSAEFQCPSQSVFSCKILDY